MLLGDEWRGGDLATLLNHRHGCGCKGGSLLPLAGGSRGYLLQGESEASVGRGRQIRQARGDAQSLMLQLPCYFCGSVTYINKNE